MEQWKIIVICYLGLALVWSLYTLFKCHKFSKSKDFVALNRQFFVYFLVFLLVVAAMVGHICFLMHSIAFAWPILGVVGLIVFGIIVPSLLEHKRKH